jgi:hypothetical protein
MVAIIQEEAATLHDATLFVAACSPPDDAYGVVVAAAATVELAARLRTRTAHPVLATGDMQAAGAWAMSMSGIALAQLTARRAELDAQDEKDAMPETAIN